ncbi:hypothetical protein MOF7_11305 [Methylobacterium oryzae]
MTEVDPAPEGALVLIAGAGRLPELVAESLRRARRPFRVIALRGFTGPALRARSIISRPCRTASR